MFQIQSIFERRFEMISWPTLTSAFDSVADSDRLAVVEVLCCFLAPAFVCIVLKVRHDGRMYLQ